MGYKIQLLPSDREFEAEANETLLEAALRSGLNLKYNCNTGNCGDCQAQVVTGEYTVARHYDFPLSEAEKIQGHILLCSVSATSDMVLEAAEVLGAQDVPLQSISVKVVRLESVNSDVMVLHLRTPRSSTLRFFAGQRITLTTQSGLSKELAIASCPCNGMMLQCHLLCDGTDAFTQYVLAEMKVTESLLLDGPWGEFTLDDGSSRPSVLVAEGIGFAPIKSLVEHAIALDHEQAIHLYRIDSTGSGHYQSNYCRAWEDAFDLFMYSPLVLKPDHDIAERLVLVKEIIARAPVESEVDLYLACSRELTTCLEEEFTARGTPPERIFKAPSD